MPRIAIVTGASSGLGREFVKQIDAGGAGTIDEIWVIARRSERLEALERTTKTPIKPFTLDLNDTESFEILGAALEQTPDAHVQLLVNNAGFGTFGDFALQPKGDAGAMCSILMRAPVEMMYLALPYMHEGARIINIASVAAFLAQPRLAVYSTAKRFVLEVSRAIDAELSDVNIHVTAVCPKFMNTEFLDHAGDAESARKMCAIGFEAPTDVVAAALAASKAGKNLCIPSPDMKAYYALSRMLPYKAAIKTEKLLGIL